MSAPNRLARRLTAPARAWDGFWFGHTSSAPFALLRSLLGISLVYWAVTLIPGINDFFGNGGIEPDPHTPSHQFNIFKFLDQDWAPGVAVGLLIGCGLLLVVGVGCRLAAPAAFVLTSSLFMDNRVIWNGGDDLLRIATLFVGLYCLLNRSEVANAPLLGYRSPPTAGEEGSSTRWWPTAPRWVLRLFQIQMTIVYWATVYEKSKGTTWASGEAWARASNLLNMQRFPVPSVLRSNMVIANGISWATLVVEIALPLLLWNRRSRRLGLFIGVMLHLLIEYSMRIGIFSFAMWICYCAFVDEGDAQGLLRFMSRFTPGRGRRHIPRAGADLVGLRQSP